MRIKNKFPVLFFFLSPVFVFSQGGVQNSTQPFDAGKINFLIDGARETRGLYVKYSLRWDYGDLEKAYLLPAALLKEAYNVNLRKDVNFKYYGYKMSPFKLFMPAVKNNTQKPDVGGNSPASSNVSSRKKKFINLSALYDDINLEEGLSDFVLRNSLNSVSGWKNLSVKEKKYFVKDLLTLGIWEHPVLKPAGNLLGKISGTASDTNKKP